MSQADRIKVLFLFSSFGYGGTDMRIWRLTRGLDTARFEAYLNCYKGEIDRRYDLDHLRYCDIRYKRIRSLGFVRALWQYVRLVRKLGIDVVQASFYEESVVAAMLQHVTGVATIYHKVDEVPVPRGLSNRLAVEYRNRHLDYATTNCNALRGWLEENEHLPMQSTLAILNGVDTCYYRPATPREKEQARAALSLPSGYFIVAAVANLSPRKRLDHLVAAASLVLKRSAQTSFVIVGEGQCRARIEDQIRRLRLEGSVHLLGSREDVRPVLWASDVGALTSDSEGFPNAILEYMAAGLPVVATNVGGICEAVCEGETGYLLPRGDTTAIAERILQLQGDVALSMRMGARGRTRAESVFALSHMVSRYESLYMEAAQTTRARQGRL